MADHPEPTTNQGILGMVMMQMLHEELLKLEAQGYNVETVQLEIHVNQNNANVDFNISFTTDSDHVHDVDHSRHAMHRLRRF